MSAMLSGTGFSRAVPLHDSDAHQSCEQIPAENVPPLAAGAVVVRVTPRSVRYELGREAWFVLPSDSTVVRAYRKRRDQEEIDAGAYPNTEEYFDNKGPL